MFRIFECVRRVLQVHHHVIVLQVKYEVADHFKVVFGLGQHLVEPILALVLIHHLEDATMCLSLELLTCLEIDIRRHVRQVIEV